MNFEEFLTEGMNAYEATRLRAGTADKNGSIHKPAYATAKAHFLSGHSLEDSIKMAREKHGL